MQSRKLDALMPALLASNAFFRNKLEPLGWNAGNPPTMADLPLLPYTDKADLVEDQATHPPFGSNLTFELAKYTRLHQTSGTTGRPLRWLDTAESWQWWLECWRAIYEVAGVGAQDRVFVAFSFGPFIGFWSAFESAQALGATVIPGGGMSSEQRLAMMRETRATVLICTPTYALRLAEIARDLNMDIANGSIRVAIHAGEPGASIPQVKTRLENAWGARVVDHPGATEIGAWGYSCGHRNIVHINEAEFIPEIVDPATGQLARPQRDGVTAGELVLTNLGRIGSPVLRYRTGDLVEMIRGSCPCGRETVALRGGVLGRADGMLVVRGVNVFPSAIENVVREFEAIDEFDVHLRTQREMAELVIRIEVAEDEASSVSKQLVRRLHAALNLRPEVRAVTPGTLPRYELKAKRFNLS